MGIAEAPPTTPHPPRLGRRFAARRPQPTSRDATRSASVPEAAWTATQRSNTLDELGHLLAAPIGAQARTSVDAALALLVGPEGAGHEHLRPEPDTPDVVRHRIAGRALVLLARDPERARAVAGRAIALLRA